MAWLTREGTIDKETTVEIESQGDRGAAIMAASYLEDYLASAIRSKMVDDKTAIKEMFERAGPLATFYAKIEMAYLLNITSKDSAEAIHRIRKIRNEFAHDLRPLTFDTPRIADQCKRLATNAWLVERRESARAEFKDNGNVLTILDMVLGPMIKLPDSPRNRYLNGVKYLVFFVGLQGMRALVERGKSALGPTDPVAGSQAPMSAPEIGEGDEGKAP